MTRPCAQARQANRVLAQGRTGAYRGVQGRTGAYLKMSLQHFLLGGGENVENIF